MGAHSCAVGHDGCHVRFLGELFEHIRPNTVLFPACVALEDAVPLAKIVWQFTPLRTGAQNPVNCLNETSTLFLLPCIGTRVGVQECVKFLPLIVGDFIGRHPTIVADSTEHNKRQRDLVQLKGIDRTTAMMVHEEHVARASQGNRRVDASQAHTTLPDAPLGRAPACFSGARSVFCLEKQKFLFGMTFPSITAH